MHKSEHTVLKSLDFVTEYCQGLLKRGGGVQLVYRSGARTFYFDFLLYFQFNSSILREVPACPRGPKAVLFHLAKFLWRPWVLHLFILYLSCSCPYIIQSYNCNNLPAIRVYINGIWKYGYMDTNTINKGWRDEIIKKCYWKQIHKQNVRGK